MDLSLFVALKTLETVHYLIWFMTRALSSNFGKGPLTKIGKNDLLNVKIWTITDLKRNNGSKTHPYNQVILVFKYHSKIGHCF